MISPAVWIEVREDTAYASIKVLIEHRKKNTL